jgi:hypothetical protein
MSAIGDIATILEALFKGRFPGAKVQWAITSCREIEHGINPARFPGVVRDADNPYPTASLATDTIEYPPNIHPLTKDQCEALLDVFQAKDITDYQAEILKPAIFNAMERIVLGVVVVLRYFRSYDRQMTIPTELLGDRTVYLRDCEWDCEWGMQGFLRS